MPKLTAHTQVATSRRYMRESGEQSSRVAKLRVQSRKEHSEHKSEECAGNVGTRDDAK
jgi:hypothetical protein